MVSSRGAKSIGEVLTLLQREFADVSISKIRFLENQGLISPERTASGYRMFREIDIERLRYVLREQREHFLPLRVIKEKLDRGEVTLEHSPTKRSDEPRTRAELLAETALSDAQLRDLEQFGLIEAEHVDAQRCYGANAVAIAHVAAQFLQRGVEARHLRQFRTAVDREVDLYRQAVVALRAKAGTQARAEAHQELAELQRLGSEMRNELLRHALRSGVS